MYQALMACPPKTAWLVTAGSLTNAALLFSTYPKVAGHLLGLSIMGGAIGQNFSQANLGKPFTNISGQLEPRIGNHTPYAEFNIWCDPEAAQSIFSNPELSRKTTLIPLDLTHQVFATKDVQDMILHGAEAKNVPIEREPPRLRRMFFELLTFFAATYANVFGLTDGPPLHDPVAVAAVLANVTDREARNDFYDIGGERFKVKVDLTEPEIGRTNVINALEGVKIPRALDTKKFWHVLNECLEEAHRKVGKIAQPEL
jgi:uridine nucleosidase